jgi:hypothetical protein
MRHRIYVEREHDHNKTMEAFMFCTKCGHQNKDDVQFCIKCGQSMQASMPPHTNKIYIPAKRKKNLAVIISISAVVLAVIITILILSANPVAGRWYSQNGTELIMLRNGKGMIATEKADQPHRIHFMYAIEYQEPGYTEGEIYEKESGSSTWFYLYDGALEVSGEYFYRQKPTQTMK